MKENKTKQQKKAFYKSGAWQEIRIKVLERDNYVCQECKRQGKDYTNYHDPDKHKCLDVDHIIEIEHYPELALDMDNLDTLCVRCHNKKHNRWGRKPNRWEHDERW